MSNADARQTGGGHYKALEPQPWNVITAWGLGFLDGNVLKYISRWRHKNGVEDLRKARHYLDKLIEQVASETECLHGIVARPAIMNLESPEGIACISVREMWPSAREITAGGFSRVIVDDNGMAGVLGMGQTPAQAWLDAADRLLKSQGA